MVRGRVHGRMVVVHREVGKHGELVDAGDVLSFERG